MSFPTERFDTFFKSKKTVSIDKISSVIIIIAALLGVNRIKILDKWSNRKKIVITVITFIVTGFSTVEAIRTADYNHFINIGLYFSCSVAGLLTYKQLVHFYQEINIFDRKVRCRPRTTFIIKNNKVFYVTTAVVILASIIFVSSNLVATGYVKIYILTFHSLHALEFYFHGHLLSLVTLRIKLIYHYIQFLPSGTPGVGERTYISGFKHFKTNNNIYHNVSYFMDLYIILLKANNHLMGTITWPFLAGVLQFLNANIYRFLLVILQCKRDNVSYTELGFLRLLIYGSLFVSNTSSVLSTCVCADQLYDEVSNLKMSLASLLYEKKIDKKSRRLARALLALTEERDLSVSLLSLVQVDSSLPLKYISVFVTYLIVLLQFQKAINDNYLQYLFLTMESLKTLLGPQSIDTTVTEQKKISGGGLMINSNMFTWAQVSMINMMSTSSLGISSKVFSFRSRIRAPCSKLSIVFKNHSRDFSNLDILRPLEFHTNTTSLMNEDQYWGCFYIFPDLYEDKYSPVVRNADEVPGLVNGLLTMDMVAIHLSYLKRTPIHQNFVLIKLDLSLKHLTNIDVLQKFKYITYLNLETNYLTDLKVLSHLLYLQYLSVDYNRLETILEYDSPQWFLSEVHYKYNSVQVINELKDFWSITVLDLSHNNIKCITDGLKQLRYLRHLDLSFNHIQRLENLDDLRLAWLDVSYNNISSYSFGRKTGLWTLLHLEYLNLNENNLTSMKVLTGCTRLQELHARNNRFSTLMELEVFTRPLKRLMVLDLRANPICFKPGYKQVILTTFPLLLQLDDLDVDPVEQRDAIMDMEPNAMSFATRRLLRLLYVEHLSRAHVSPYVPPADTKQVPLIILVGYEAVGKGELARRLVAEYKGCAARAFLHTTATHHYRDHYIEVTRDQFDRMLIEGKLLTYAEINGESYGLSREEAYIIDGKVKIACMDLTSALMLKLRGRRPYLILITPNDKNNLSRSQYERKCARLSNAHSHRSTLQVLLSGHIIVRGIINEIVMNLDEDSPYDTDTTDFLIGSECSIMMDSEWRVLNRKVSAKMQDHVRDVETSAAPPATSATKIINKLTANNETSMHSLFKAQNAPEDYVSVMERSGEQKQSRSKKISDSSRQNYSKSSTWKTLGSEGAKSSKSVTFTSYNTIHKKEGEGQYSIRSNYEANELEEEGTLAGCTLKAPKSAVVNIDPIYKSISCKVPFSGQRSSDNSMDIDLWFSFLVENGLLQTSETTVDHYGTDNRGDSQSTYKFSAFDIHALTNDNIKLPSEKQRKHSIKNDLDSIHRNNPGLFWDTINSDDHESAFCKLKKIVMDIVKSQHQFKPMFDIDFANMDCYPTVQKKLLNIRQKIAPQRLFH